MLAVIQAESNDLATKALKQVSKQKKAGTW